MSSSTTSTTAKRPLGPIAAALLIVVCGIGYSVFARVVGAGMDAPVRLDPPLKSLPMQIDGWSGTDMSVDAGVLRIAGNDDFVNRVYVDEATGRNVSLYVAYTAKPRTMLRHRPSVCYPSAGWTPVGDEVDEVTTADGRTLPVRVQYFSKRGLREERVAVLNYYVLAGNPTIDEHSFWSLGWRTPNFARDASRYVAQVQVIASAGVDGKAPAYLKEFAALAAPHVLTLLPGTTP